MKAYYHEDGITIYHGDCREVLPCLAGLHAVITDPPYPNEFDAICSFITHLGFRACGPDAFLWTLCGHYQLPRVMDAARIGGWQYWWLFIANNRNQPIMHGFKTKCCYKPAPCFRKGEALPSRIMVDDVALRVQSKSWTTSKSAHEWGQPESLFFEAIDALVPTDGCFVDPCMGGGATLMAARRMRRQAIGIELDERSCEIAAERLSQPFLPWEADDGAADRWLFDYTVSA